MTAHLFALLYHQLRSAAGMPTRQVVAVYKLQRRVCEDRSLHLNAVHLNEVNRKINKADFPLNIPQKHGACAKIKNKQTNKCFYLFSSGLN